MCLFTIFANKCGFGRFERLFTTSSNNQGPTVLPGGSTEKQTMFFQILVGTSMSRSSKIISWGKNKKWNFYHWRDRGTFSLSQPLSPITTWVTLNRESSVSCVEGRSAAGEVRSTRRALSSQVAHTSRWVGTGWGVPKAFSFLGSSKLNSCMQRYARIGFSFKYELWLIDRLQGQVLLISWNVTGCPPVWHHVVK